MLWLKAFHIFFVVSWMAGLLYLPRLFVYHTEVKDEDAFERFLKMERRLYFGIMWPAMILSLASGLWMLVLGWEAFSRGQWIYFKLSLVGLLVVYHWVCGVWHREFRSRSCQRSERFFRYVNEIPAVALLVITILVVVKPI